MSDPLFLPFRALGYITDSTPFAVQRKGRETWVTTSVGKSWQVYNCAKLTLSLVGPQARWVAKSVLPTPSHISGSPLPSGKLVQWMVHVCMQKEIEFEDGFEPTCMAHPPTYLNKVLVGARDGRMQLWNINTATLLYTFSGFASAVRCLEPSPALDVVGVGLADGGAVLHNIRFDELLMRFDNASGVGAGSDQLLAGGAGQPQSTGGGACSTISFRTGKGAPLMAAGGGAGVITVWNLEERKLATVIKDAHNGPLARLHFFPGEPLLMSSAADNAVKHWIFDNADGTARLLRGRSGHASPPLHVRYYGEESSVLLTAAEDQAVRVFSVIQDQQSRELSQVHTKQRAKRLRVREQDLKLPPVLDMSAASMRERDWSNMLTAHAGDPTVYAWQLAKYKLVDEELVLPAKQRLDGTLPAPATAVLVSQCGNFGFVGTSAGRLDRYNMQSGIHRGAYMRPPPEGGGAPVPAHSAAIIGLGADSCNKRVVSVDHTGAMRVWGFKDGKMLADVSVGCAVSKLMMHPHSMLAALACGDRVVRVFDVERACCVRRFAGHSDRLTDVALSADSKWVLSASMDGTVRVWDVPAASCLQAMNLGSPVTSISISPNSELLATAHVNRRGIYLWSNQMLFGRGGSIMPSSDPVNVRMPTVATGHRAGDAADDEDAGAEVTDSWDSDMDDFGSDDEEARSSQTHHDDSEDDEAAEAAGRAESYRAADAAGVPVPLSDHLVTLSGLPASHWESLVHLDTIKARNKPLQAPEKPEAAPFFLPTVPSLQGPQLVIGEDVSGAHRGPLQDPFAEESLVMDDPMPSVGPQAPSQVVRSRPATSGASTFVELLQSGYDCGDYTSATAWLRQASPAAVDRELRALILLPPFSEEEVHQLVLVLEYIAAQLSLGKGFDHTQGLLSLTLQLHGDSIAQVPHLQALAQIIHASLAQRWSRLDDDVHSLRCMIGFFGNMQF